MKRYFFFFAADFFFAPPFFAADFFFAAFFFVAMKLIPPYCKYSREVQIVPSFSTTNLISVVGYSEVKVLTCVNQFLSSAAD